MRKHAKNLLKYLLSAFGMVLFTLIIFRLTRNVQHAQQRDEVLKERFVNRNQQISQNSDDSNEKIDWHDYEAIRRDARRTGTGEQGAGATFDASDPRYEQLYRVNGFNAAVSDLIAIDRSLQDNRHKGCKNKKYLKYLPSVSVIVPFHNEHWTTLLRTVQSVLNRSPEHLLKEIILVDDASTKSFSKQPLDDYLVANMTKVRAIHLTERSGLIRTRSAGAKEAVGDILLFLDSHSEVNVNWLPPLLEPIKENYRTCTCPFIDIIHHETFQFKTQDEGARGAFDWNLLYKRLPLLPSDYERPTEPFRSPVMAGGLFAISRKFFWELGGYDDGLDIWGGEQYELSFKIWMCGGMLVDCPCSRVGHIYRKYSPFPNPGRGDFLSKNFKRVAVVWMDEYAEYVYRRQTQLRDFDPGDVSAQKAIRDKLQCKSFKWFMDVIAFDLPQMFPFIEPEDVAIGEIRNVGAAQLCVDSGFQEENGVIVMKECIRGTNVEGEQNFTLTWRKEIRPRGRDMCWDVADQNDRANVTLYPCHNSRGNQYWRYDLQFQWLVHGDNPRCLDCDSATKKLFVTKCTDVSSTQKWQFEKVNITAIENWDTIGV